MHKLILSVRRAILRWQLHNLESGIRHILIARSQALATMVEMQEARALKERQLARVDMAFD
jgi:hypothetical protein